VTPYGRRDEDWVACREAEGAAMKQPTNAAIFLFIGAVLAVLELCMWK